jgi:3-phosphoshikimate 1-carboxyvinyltransferase
MQAKIKIKIDRSVRIEPQGEITIASSKLRGTTVYPGEIPFIIDELPVLRVAACFAGGRTTIKGVGELRVKETDRINAMLVNLKKMGADIRIVKEKGIENIIICGDAKLHGAQMCSFADHRTAMSMVVAAQAAAGPSRLDDTRCISKSFPNFLATLNSFKLR